MTVKPGKFMVHPPCNDCLGNLARCKKLRTTLSTEATTTGVSGTSRHVVRWPRKGSRMSEAIWSETLPLAGPGCVRTTGKRRARPSMKPWRL